MNKPDLFLLKQIFEEEVVKSQNATLEKIFSKRLFLSMDYALKTKGKRLRPLLALSMAIASNRNASVAQVIKWTMPASLAIEFIHTYSLIHDDLPAMDNDDLRRGKPSVHKRFDEGLAILAGDALLADAFYWASFSKHNCVEICRELAMAAGSRGLCAGQAEDLNRYMAKDLSSLLAINVKKTASLFESSSILGALSVDANKESKGFAKQFGHAFGVAFQIQDDLNDNSEITRHASRQSLTQLLSENLNTAHEIAKQFDDEQILRDLLHFTFAS